MPYQHNFNRNRRENNSSQFILLHGRRGNNFNRFTAPPNNRMFNYCRLSNYNYYESHRDNCYSDSNSYSRHSTPSLFSNSPSAPMHRSTSKSYSDLSIKTPIKKMRLASHVPSSLSKLTKSRFSGLKINGSCNAELPERMSEVYNKFQSEVGSEHKLKLIKLAMSLLFRVNSILREIKKKYAIVDITLSSYKFSIEEINREDNVVIKNNYNEKSAHLDLSYTVT